jgi:hypothetical protein
MLFPAFSPRLSERAADMIIAETLYGGHRRARDICVTVSNRAALGTTDFDDVRSHRNLLANVATALVKPSHGLYGGCHFN